MEERASCWTEEGCLIFVSQVISRTIQDLWFREYRRRIDSNQATIMGLLRLAPKYTALSSFVRPQRLPLAFVQEPCFFWWDCSLYKWMFCHLRLSHHVGRVEAHLQSVGKDELQEGSLRQALKWCCLPWILHCFLHHLQGLVLIELIVSMNLDQHLILFHSRFSSQHFHSYN